MQTYMLEISMCPSLNDGGKTNTLFDKIKKDIALWRADVAKEENGVNITSIFKVTGEKKAMTVVKSSNPAYVDAIVGLLPAEYDVKVSALKPYEDFAKAVLKITDDKLTSPSPRNLPADGSTIMWVTGYVDYKGKTYDELIEIWAEEAVAVLSTRQKGATFEVYKAVAERVVHFITSMEQDALDNLIFGLPIVQKNGDQTKFIAKSVMLL
ncbi:unnamed protein product [Owenia fusiformis]|uniref:Uncharacterized protein n=1 Tax=Owenia fusiformis TaxID=6347 RepID=A0A8S4PGG4_OWEFU|nr:unnamed protein product [Owenia fusiformis]